jgi:uncharacterized cupin superfamily protein
MQRTVIDGVRMWSVWQPDRNLYFNSFFIETPHGNVAVDPLALDDAGRAEIAGAGGLAWVIVTNRDHERSSRPLAAEFGAKIAASALDAPELSAPVDRELRSGDELCGLRALGLDGFKTSGEIALFMPKARTAILGDALWGSPAGALTFMADAKLRDPARAVLSMRRVAALRPEHLLVGDGACIFGGATRAMWACLEARADVYVNKINVDEAFWRHDPEPGKRADEVGSWADLDFEIGAEKLGYRVARLPKDDVFCPLHWHTGEEELFVVLDGNPSLRTPRGTVRLRKGDFVAFPTRESGAHKLINDGDGPCEVLMVSNVDPDDVCTYPDSHKVLIERRDIMIRDQPVLDYFDGER